MLGFDAISAAPIGGLAAISASPSMPVQLPALGGPASQLLAVFRGERSNPTTTRAAAQWLAIVSKLPRQSGLD